MKRVTTDEGTLLISDLVVPVTRGQHRVRVHHPSDTPTVSSADTDAVWLTDKSVPRGTVVKAYPASRPMTATERRTLQKASTAAVPGAEGKRSNFAALLTDLYGDGVSVSDLADAVGRTSTNIRQMMALATEPVDEVRLVCLLPTERTRSARAATRTFRVFRPMTAEERENLQRAYAELPKSAVDGRHLFHNRAGDALLALIVSLTDTDPAVSMRSVCDALGASPNGWLHRTVARYRQQQQLSWPELDDEMTQYLSGRQRKSLTEARTAARRWGTEGRVSWGHEESVPLRDFVVKLLHSGWTAEEVHQLTGVALQSIVTAESFQ